MGWLPALTRMSTLYVWASQSNNFANGLVRRTNIWMGSPIDKLTILTLGAAGSCCPCRSNRRRKAS